MSETTVDKDLRPQIAVCVSDLIIDILKQGQSDQTYPKQGYNLQSLKHFAKKKKKKLKKLKCPGNIKVSVQKINMLIISLE